MSKFAETHSRETKLEMSDSAKNSRYNKRPF